MTNRKERFRYDLYDLVTGKVTDVIARLQELEKRNPGATLHYELDYSQCYYEGDHPSPIVTVKPKQ